MDRFWREVVRLAPSTSFISSPRSSSYRQPRSHWICFRWRKMAGQMTRHRSYMQSACFADLLGHFAKIAILFSYLQRFRACIA